MIIIGARARHAGSLAWLVASLLPLAAPAGCNRQPARPGASQTPKRAPTPTPASALVTAAGAITGTADDNRTGWYPDQPRLDPAVVAGPTFGRLWKTALPLAPADQVFAQPLVMGGTVFVATEGNNIYALDGESGSIKASRALGPAWRAADIGCSDLKPYVGITGTPVIDTATRTAYFFSKRYLDDRPSPAPENTIWYAHAVDVDTLAERRTSRCASRGPPATIPASGSGPSPSCSARRCC
jgi:hypothetical protein